MDFSKRLIDWYEIEKRDLPWRHTQDPYTIWLSEIILQQTQVKQGLPYFLKFINEFPTVHDLAQATEDRVMKLWQGLGYYSRARNLHFTAKYVSQHLNGEFPKGFAELKSLKGVGDYTAAAIASFAYDEPVAVVDGNVQRVLSRFLGITLPINSTEGSKVLKHKAQELLDPSQPALYNQAIMEFGALHCKPKSPKCMFCHFQQDCVAYQHGQVEELPVKLKTTQIKKRYFNYLVIKDEEHNVLVQKRTGSGIWNGLYEFPLQEALAPQPSPGIKAIQDLLETSDLNIEGVNLYNESPVIHLLSHRKIYAHFYVIEVEGLLSEFNFSKPIEIYKHHDLKQLPVPVLIQNFIEAEFSTA